MANRPCLDCGRPTSATRCPNCERIRERSRPQRPTNLTRDWQERQRRAAAVYNWLQTYGPICPGWQREPHRVHPKSLTADHIESVASGGDPYGPLTVLCRPCNGAKAAA
jgi:hypothetical protein